jgi:hypothetical protein
VNRSRLRRSTAVTATVGAGIFALMAAQPALAAPTPAAAGDFTANGSATLARLDINAPATPLFPAGSGNLSLVRAENTVDSAHDQAVKAGASFIAGEALGHKAPDLPKNSVSQTAPADNAAPATSSLVDIPQNPLLWGSILPANAHARWNDSIACPTGPAEIATSQAKVADLKALTTAQAAELPIAVPGVADLPIGDDVTVVDLPDTLRSSTAQGFVAVDGQKGLGVASTASISVAKIILFKNTPAQTTIKVVSPPRLTATAAGSEGGSSVDYDAPILEIEAPGGQKHRIDAPGEEYEIGMKSLDSLPGGLESALQKAGAAAPAQLPALPALPAVAGESPYLAKLSLGKVTDVVEDANTAQGRLTMLRLDLLSPDGKTPLASLSLGDMRAQATAPDGGVVCNPSPSVLPTETTPGDGSGPVDTLPVTGSDVTLLVAGGGALLLLGRFAMVAAARRQ